MKIDARWNVKLVVVMSIIVAQGCAGGGGANGSSPRASKAGVEGTNVDRRPRLQASAAEAFPGNGSEQLDFFDELESRELVTQDDAIHAVLLVARGSSAPTFVQRAAIAKRAGIVEQTWSPQPRDAITTVELASMVAGATRPGGASTGAASGSAAKLAELQSSGVIPAEWRPNRGVSGLELLAVLRRASDANAAASVPTQAE